jgi:hypothetical protein
MKEYYLKFGTGDSANYSGLTPTMTIFALEGVTALIAPGITETPAGTGLYRFLYGTTTSIIFKCDGGAALTSGDRYIYGALDPVQRVDENIGVPTDSYGTTTTDPTTLFGKANRAQEFLEGDQTYVKSTGVWSVKTRGGTLMQEKTLANNTTQTTRS